MTMFKTILMFIWLFTGYFCNSEDPDEESTDLPSVTSAFKKVIKASESEPPQNGNNHVPKSHPLTLLVAGISISLVLLFILVIIGVWYAWKKSKESLAEANSVPSVESGVSLKRISTYENQCESPFERALQCQQENCCMTLWSVHLYGRTAQTTGLQVNNFSLFSEERRKESPPNYSYSSSTLKRAPSSKKLNS